MPQLYTVQNWQQCQEISESVTQLIVLQPRCPPGLHPYSLTWCSSRFDVNFHSQCQSIQYSLMVLKHSVLTQGTRAFSTHSWYQSIQYSLMVLEHSVLTQGTRAFSIHSWCQSIQYSLMVLQYSINDLDFFLSSVLEEAACWFPAAQTPKIITQKLYY